jgi:hypothetical protein
MRDHVDGAMVFQPARDIAAVGDGVDLGLSLAAFGLPGMAAANASTALEEPVTMSG